MSRGWAGIARLGGIGDNLAAASPMKALKKLGYMTEMITSQHAGEIFHNNPYIDKVSIKYDGDLPEGYDWQKWFASRAKEYELFANLSGSMEGRHAHHRTSTQFYWPAPYRRRMCSGSYLETAHDILGVPYDFSPLFFPTDAEWERGHATKDKIGKYMVWVLAGSRPDKAYPFMSHAICRIIKELGIAIVMVGHGGAQFQMAKAIESDVQKTNSSLDGLHLALSPDDSDPGGHQNWSVRRSLTQCLLADLVITPDTGPGWATAMEKMAKIVLVSHASAENITKHWVNTRTLHADPARVPCWPCHRLHDDMTTCVRAKENPEAAACMADISVETIVRETADVMRPRNVVKLEAAE